MKLGKEKNKGEGKIKPGNMDTNSLDGKAFLLWPSPNLRVLQFEYKT